MARQGTSKLSVKKSVRSLPNHARGIVGFDYLELCRSFFVEGKSEVSVAKQLQISKRDVSPLLKDAFQKGILQLVSGSEKLPAGQSSTAIAKTKTSIWTEAKDNRRCQLIDRELAGLLTPNEQLELNQLQQEMLDYRRSVAPLPLEAARQLHKSLLTELGKKD